MRHELPSRTAWKSPARALPLGKPRRVSSRGSAVHSLADLRRAQPADGALRNLLGILTAKLELFASLPVFEYEAATEGNDAFAAAFRRLAEQERRSFDELIACLRTHLNETAPAADGDAAAGSVQR
jgi:hypothetical protein